MGVQTKKRRRKLTDEEIFKIILKDVEELICPFFDPGIHGRAGEGNCKRMPNWTCHNPREWETCFFITGRTDGLTWEDVAR